MSTISVIVGLCVAIPAFIAITVCAIVYHSYRSKHRTFRHRISLPSRSPDGRIAYISRTDYNQQQPRRLRGPLPTFEQPPPAYNTYPIRPTRRQPIPLFSHIQTVSTRTNIHRSLPIVAPSVYTALPPSYDELFLTPQTLTNR